MKIGRYFFVLISLMLGLSGCTSMNSQFDCPMKPGIRCESLDQVNSRVDRGEIGDFTVVKTSSNHSFITQQSTSTVLLDEPIRTREAVMPIWVAPYEDTAGNYHQESMIYTVVKPAVWRGQPPKVTINGE